MKALTASPPCNGAFLAQAHDLTEALPRPVNEVSAGTPAFRLEETHGILKRLETNFIAVSESLGWSNVFASVQRESPYEAEYESRPHPLIVLHLNGYVKVDRWIGVNRESRMVPPGGLFIAPSGMDFRVRLGAPLSTMHFYLRRSMLEEVATDLTRGDPQRLEFLPRIGESDPLLECILADLRNELLDPNEMGETYVDYLACAAAARLIKGHTCGQQRFKPSWKSLMDDDRRKTVRATEFVNAYLNRNIRLKELAVELDLSTSQLAALFKRALGQPPHRFIMNLRVSRARGMLVATNLPLCEIALACGFSHQEHMTRIFKRETGLTPAVYRRAASC